MSRGAGPHTWALVLPFIGAFKSGTLYCSHIPRRSCLSLHCCFRKGCIYFPNRLYSFADSRDNRRISWVTHRITCTRTAATHVYLNGRLSRNDQEKNEEIGAGSIHRSTGVNRIGARTAISPCCSKTNRHSLNEAASSPDLYSADEPGVPPIRGSWRSVPPPSTRPKPRRGVTPASRHCKVRNAAVA